MFSFGKRSTREKETLCPPLQRILEGIIKVFDISVLKGTRGEEEQNRDFDNGATTLRYPDSNHNESPSNAVDCAPYPINWNILSRFYRMMALAFREANKIKAKIRSGGDWRRDGSLNNYIVRRTGLPPLMDLPHIEYKGIADDDQIEKQERLADIYDAKAQDLERKINIPRNYEQI